MDNFDPQATGYDSRNALWLGQAAELAYAYSESDPEPNQKKAQGRKTLQSWGLANFAPLFDAETDTQGYLAGNGEMVLVTFRGTVADKFDNWLTDLDVPFTAGPVGRVHQGFYERGLMQVWEQLAAALPVIRNVNQPLWLTGHSLGAALACLAAAKLVQCGLVSSVAGLYTFGQPRTGDETFAAWLDGLMKPKTFRFVDNNDIVPHVPPSISGYKHAGTFSFFDADGDIKADEGFWSGVKDALEGRVEDLWKHGLVPPVIEDHFMENYLAALERNVDKNPFAV